MKKLRMTNKLRDSINGWLFISPFVIGFLLLFLSPLISSIIYSFNNVIIGIGGGFDTKYIGFDNYFYILTKDLDFPQKFIYFITGDLLPKLPVITMFSLFVALILNQKFKGQLLSRSIFFLPVVITSGVIISVMKLDTFSTALSNGEAQQTYAVAVTSLDDLQKFLPSLGIPTAIIPFFLQITNSILDIVWKCGVQIIVFLSALQSVPKYLYEVAKIEGASAWETFVKITFPMVSPFILVVAIYTIIDSYTDYSIDIMQYMNNTLQQLMYGTYSAMVWLFVAVVTALIAVVYLLCSKISFYSV